MSANVNAVGGLKNVGCEEAYEWVVTKYTKIAVDKCKRRERHCLKHIVDGHSEKPVDICQNVHRNVCKGGVVADLKEASNETSVWKDGCE